MKRNGSSSRTWRLNCKFLGHPSYRSCPLSVRSLHLLLFQILIDAYATNMSNFSSTISGESISIWFTFAAAFLLWAGVTIVYRLWLGPLAAFPGPKLAALSGWYETYYDCFKRGRYWVVIEQMHQEYGKRSLPSSSGQD